MTWLMTHWNESFVMSHDCAQATRPTQSIMYIPFQVNRYQKSILLIVQYKYSESCSEDLILKNPTKIWFSAQDHAVLRVLLNLVGFFISARQKSTWWKWFVPELYQLRRSILEGPAHVASGCCSLCHSYELYRTYEYVYIHSLSIRHRHRHNTHTRTHMHTHTRTLKYFYMIHRVGRVKIRPLME